MHIFVALHSLRCFYWVIKWVFPNKVRKSIITKNRYNFISFISFKPNELLQTLNLIEYIANISKQQNYYLFHTYIMKYVIMIEPRLKFSDFKFNIVKFTACLFFLGYAIHNPAQRIIFKTWMHSFRYSMNTEAHETGFEKKMLAICISPFFKSPDPTCRWKNALSTQE